MRHITSKAGLGSHIPLALPTPLVALDARSIGTRRIMLAGNAIARKIGSVRKAGVVRKGK